VHLAPNPPTPIHDCTPSALQIVSVSQTIGGIRIIVHNPAEITVQGVLVVELEFRGGERVIFGIPLTLEPGQTVVVEIVTTASVGLVQIQACGNRPWGIVESPDPIQIIIHDVATEQAEDPI